MTVAFPPETCWAPMKRGLLRRHENPRVVASPRGRGCGGYRAGRVRIRARLCAETEGFRLPDREEASDRVHARGHEDESGCGPATDVARRLDERPRPPDEQGGEHGEIVRGGHRDGSHHGRRPDPWRGRLHEG